MSDNEKTLWGIHGGRTGDADNLFLKKNSVALGWNKLGNLAELSPNREAFKTKMTTSYPEAKLGAIPVNAGQLFRFVNEMKTGDYVLYPSKVDGQIHIGQIIGEYKYDPITEPGYPNQRAVKWLRTFPRTHFTQGALYEIGSALSFFQVKNYADEFFNTLERKNASEPISVEKDETIAYVADEIEQTTRDFILKQLSQELKGHPLAAFVAHLLEAMGYRTRVSPEGADGGVDIIAHKDELGFEPPIIKVQVKSSDKNIGSPDVQALYGNIDGSNHEFGLFVSLATFSPPARNFARSKSNLRIIDGTELVDLVLQHYEQLDSRYKALIPLKRVYIPQALQEEE